MDEALGDLPFVAVYVDDICALSSGATELSEAEVFQQLLQHLETVLWRLAKAGITLAPGRGSMAVRQIVFLDHWEYGEGVFPQRSMVKVVVKMPPPTDVAGLRRSLGMVGYYGKFIGAGLSSSTPSSAARNDGLGAVLAHEDDEGRDEHVVDFTSRTCQLRQLEPNYASYEASWKVGAGEMRLSEYDFAVRYRKGVNNVNAHCLSRGPVESNPTELDGRGEFSPERTVRHAAACSGAGAESSRQPELSAWARRRDMDTAHEGAANGDLVAVTGELSAGPRRGDPWMDVEAMAELQAGNVNMPQPYA
eukprot:jgi/Tetstr1/460952/TSEL_006104.t1